MPIPSQTMNTSVEGIMITSNFNPAASKPSLLNGIKPVVEEVQGPTDRRAIRPSFYEEVVPPHMRTKNSVDALSETQNAKAETKTPVEPTQPDAELNENLASKGYTQVDKITAEQASGNILDFVRQGLAQAASRGKSQEELQTMLNQARQGVEEGFAKASAELKDLGLMGEELAENIQASRDLVEAGIDDLEAKLLGKAPVEANAPAKVAAPLLQNIQSFQGSRSLEQSMELQLKTKEGDVITLLWGHSESKSLSYGQGEGYQAMRANASSSSQLNYSVVGDLNDQERAELDAFLQASFDFADKFFNPRGDQTMQQALDYVEVFNGLETMNSLDLRLTQTKTQQAAATYGQVGRMTPEDFDKEPKGPSLLSSAVADELKTLRDLADKALADQKEIRPLFQSLPDMMGADSAQGQSFLKLMDGLFGRLGLDAAA
jgi:hypothetical protein